MKRDHLILILIFVIGFILAGCGQAKDESAPKSGDKAAQGVEVNISAAASLTDALNEIKTEYSKDHKDVLLFNFGASGTLEKQIEEGAPCDLFLSASKANMDTLEQTGLIDTDSRKDLLGNTLTLIASAEKKDVIKGYEALASNDAASISIGTPETVPAGKYAQQSLENLGLWPKIEKKIVFGKDVKQVLEYVDTGNADCGLVYKTDAMQMKTGVVVMDMPENSHDPIVYPAALIRNSEQEKAAADFYQFLQSDYAKGVFEKYGFTVLL